MIASIAVVLAVLALPTAVILGLLILLGSAVAVMADGGAPGGLLRRPAS
jgi:hypothetical protein